jgi:hypothetical protein
MGRMERNTADRRISVVFFKVRSAYEKTLENLLGVEVLDINLL